MNKTFLIIGLLLFSTIAFSAHESPVTPNQNGFFDSFFKGISEFVDNLLSYSLGKPVEQKKPLSDYTPADQFTEADFKPSKIIEEQEFNELIIDTQNSLNLSSADYTFLNKRFGENYHAHLTPIFSDGTEGKGVHIVKCGDNVELLIVGEKEPCRTIHDTTLKAKWSYIKSLRGTKLTDYAKFSANIFNGNVQVPLMSLGDLYSLAELPSLN